MKAIRKWLEKLHPEFATAIAAIMFAVLALVSLPIIYMIMCGCSKR